MAKARTTSRTVDTYTNTVGLMITIPSTAGQVNEKVSSAYSSKDRVGMIIHTVEYIPQVLNAMFDTAGDRVRFGLAVAPVQQSTGHQVSDAGVMDFNAVSRMDFGTAATGWLVDHTIIRKSFADYPGGGKLVHPAFLYVWGYSESTLALGIDMDVRIDYTTISLTDADWSDLWQNMILLTTV